MYKLYVNGKFYDDYISLEVALLKARKYLRLGDDIELRQSVPTFTSYIQQVEHADNALLN